MTLDRHAPAPGVRIVQGGRQLETPLETSSGADITSSVAAKQLRKSDSGLQICVADPQTDDSTLHTAVAEFELADSAGDNIVPPSGV
jgi:hypothetical protein